MTEVVPVLTVTKLRVMVITVLVMVYTQCKPCYLDCWHTKNTGYTTKRSSNTDWVDIDNIVIGDGSTALTNSYSNNFTGNFVWIRS